MKPVMYVFMNAELGMSKGKFGAQSGHAAVRAYIASDPKLREQWLDLGETKLVMIAQDAAQLDTYERYINDKGFRTALIIDEGRTEIPAHTKTALGVEIVDKADPHVLATFESFKLYPNLGYHVYTVPDIPLADALHRVPREYLSRAGKKDLDSRL